MLTVQSNNYDASKIQVLEGLEAVRKRPGMYIGSTSSRGLHQLVWDIVEYSIEEALAGYCDMIKVIVNEDNSITLIDNGRGIPVEIHPKMGKPTLEVVMTVLNVVEEGYKFSGGLFGISIFSVVNALSAVLEVQVHREGKIHYQKYLRGVPEADLRVIGTTDISGTHIRFLPDPTIFTETTAYEFNTLQNRLHELSLLNHGIHITLEDKRRVGK